VKTIAPLLAAGSAFAGTVLAALLAGIWLDHRFATSHWVLVLFFGGLVLGAYAAWRLVARTILP
jgi:F0F1-type ATP synthase assembly protein I